MFFPYICINDISVNCHIYLGIRVFGSYPVLTIAEIYLRNYIIQTLSSFKSVKDSVLLTYKAWCKSKSE